MNLCLPYTPCLVHPLWIVTWKVGCPCVSLCLLFLSPWLWSHTLFRMCTYISTWIYVNLAAYAWSTPICIVWWKPGCPCMAVCLCPSHLISVPTPCLECVHASVHEFMSTLHPMSGPPLWIVTWKVGCPCVSLHVCPSHLNFVPTPCLECVHASVHEFMSTWLLMSGPLPMHSLMETWVPLYGSVFVSQSSYFCSHTLFRMCLCISTYIYVHLPPHVSSTSYG